MFDRFPLKLSVCLLALVAGGGQVFAATRSDSPTGGGTDGSWLVKIGEGVSPEEVASSVGAVYAGPLRGVKGYHRMRFITELESRPGGGDAKAAVVRQLAAQTEVIEFEEETVVYRYPRNFEPRDPRFPEQWHLENVGQSGGIPFADIRVRAAWDEGLSGDGVVVGIVDQGIQYTHPDLIENFLTGSGYDFVEDDADPLPASSQDNHGTAVAGITLAVSNGIGGLGVSHRAKLVPIRFLVPTGSSGGVTNADEAEALSWRWEEVDIYNNSWGPSDDFGIRYADTSQVVRSALVSNSVNGRGGLGNIYVWAAGNGGLNGDNSNYDGYNASPYTISVAAIGDDGIKAGYSEPGANLLVAAPSRGRGAGILTTDITGDSGYATGDYYENFSGTSAAAPVVSGVVALLLEKRPDLGWRDVQKILALTASPVDFSSDKWERNGAGHWVSHGYGFGRVDAAAAVALAEGWPVMGPSRTAFGEVTPNAFLPEGQTISRIVNVNTALKVQHVRVRVTFNHDDWGDLRIVLQSPSGTRSVLSEPHANANAPGQPGTWTYLSTRHLDETSNGQWTLSVTDEGSGASGSLTRWSVEIWGTSVNDSGNRPPVAEDLVVEGTRFPVDVNVLEGISDPDGDPLTVIAIQQPQFGELEEVGNGRLRYTMGETRDGTDLISVLVSDGRGGVARRIVQFLDPRPVALNDVFPVQSGLPVELPVLRNDFDPDGDSIRILSLSGNYAGTASITANGTILYQAAPGFTGVDRIQYEVTDDSDGNSRAWATVVVQDIADVALDFDGEDDFMRLPETAELPLRDTFTIEAWIYPQDWGEYVTGFGRIVDRASFSFFLNGLDHDLYADRSLVAYFVMEDGTVTAANTATGSIELNKWQRVAVTFDSNAFAPVRIHVDGQSQSVSYPLADTTAPRQPLSDSRASPRPYIYFGEADSGARAFKGRMTEFRIWDRALSIQEIQSRQTVRLTGNEPGLRLYFPLDQTLEPEARSIGELTFTAEIFEARRVPFVLPWEPLLARYRIIDEQGNGWWEDRTLGWIYGDAFPWVYSPAFGWLFTGQDTGRTAYLLHTDFKDWGWIRTTANLFPWFYRHKDDSWLWFLEGSESPAWIYSFGDSGWSVLPPGS